VLDDPQVPLVLPEWLTPLNRELERTVDRLRGRSLSRLARPLTDGPGPAPTAAEALHRLAQHLADEAAAVEGRTTRALPWLDVHVLPDQVAVVGHDLVVALARSDQPDDARRQRAAAAAAALVAIRQPL